MYRVTLPARRKRIAFFVYCGYAVLLQTGREGSNLLLLCAQMGRIWSHLLFSTENDLKRCWHHPPSFPPPHPLSVRHTTHSLFHSAKQQVTTILGALRQRGVAAMCRQRSITARFLYDSPILLLIRYRLRPSRSRSRKRSGECGERERASRYTRIIIRHQARIGSCFVLCKSKPMRLCRVSDAKPIHLAWKTRRYPSDTHHHGFHHLKSKIYYYLLSHQLARVSFSRSHLLRKGGALYNLIYFLDIKKNLF